MCSTRSTYEREFVNPYPELAFFVLHYGEENHLTDNQARKHSVFAISSKLCQKIMKIMPFSFRNNAYLCEIEIMSAYPIGISALCL